MRHTPRLLTLSIGTLAALTAVGCAGTGSRHAQAPEGARAPGLPAASDHGSRTQTADQQVQQVLNRLAFGPRPGDAEAVRALGVDAWIARQLEPARLDDAKVERALASLEITRLSAAELERAYPRPGVLLNQLERGGTGVTRDDSLRLREATMGYRRVIGEVGTARVARAVTTERQLQEVLTDFWLNHFSVYAGKGGPQPYFLAEYENTVVRPRVLGRFRDLLGAVAHSPAMLFYLDNWESAADSTRPRLSGGPVASRSQLPSRNGGAVGRGGQRPLAAAAMDRIIRQRFKGLNENYGRELLELHTLGVDGGYTQRDVQEAARILTGWTFRGAAQGGGFQFIPAMHDAGEKSVLGTRFPAGRGVEEGEALLDLLARHPSTARHIATKLARRFVSDTPPAALVERAARVFTDTDGDLRAVTWSIVTSPEFFARDAYRSKVKSPFEVVVSALRATGAPPDLTPRSALVVAALGQPIYGRQSPDGWPETGDAWMNTGAILNRINFGLALAAGRVPGASPAGIPDAATMRTLPRDQQVDAAVRALLGGDVSPVTREVLVSGVNPLLGSAPAPLVSVPDDFAGGAGGVAMPGQQVQRLFNRLPTLTGWAQVVGLAVGSPEFQRR